MPARSSRAALVLPAVLLATAARGALAQPDISLDFSRAGDSVQISVSFAGDDDGSTLVGLAEDWGGIRTSAEEMHQLAATTTDTGEPCPIAPETGAHWTIAHPPGSRITLHYELRPESREPLGLGRLEFRPMLREGLFHAIGNHALILPAQRPGPHRVTVTWTGFEGWTGASSLGPGLEPRTAAHTIEQLQNSFFIAGAPGQVSLTTRDLGGTTIGLASIDADWGFTPDRLLDMICRIVSVERDFFDDHDDPWYLVALTPNGMRAGENGSFFGGTGLTDCFALYCNTGMDLSPGSDNEQRIEHLLAHEYFHNWNGVGFRVDAPEGAAYWFSEGFTEFYTRRLLHRAGLWDDEQWLADLNESVAGYDRNPKRSVPNTTIIEAFWADRDVSEIPYRRGDLLALALDEAASQNPDSGLDELMRDLHRRAAEGRPMPTPDEMFGLVGAITGEEFARAFRRCIEDGEPVPLPQTIAGGRYELADGTIRVGDDGFDVEGSREAGKIIGLREGAGAHDAGLREGDPLVSIDRLPPVDGPGRLRVITLDADGAEHEVVFEAVSAPQTVRCYKPAGN